MRNFSTIVNILQFSTSFMWRNLKFRYIFQISPHLPCIEIWNFATQQIFLHMSHMWTLWQIWGMAPPTPLSGRVSQWLKVIAKNKTRAKKWTETVDERGLDAPDGNGRSKGNRTLGQMQSRLLRPSAAAAIGGIHSHPTRISWYFNQNIKIF